MIIVIGIDSKPESERAIKVLKALGISGELHLVHVIEPIMPDGQVPIPISETHPLGDIYDKLQKRGQDLLTNAKSTANMLGFDTKEKIAFGNPARALVSYCDEIGAKLVVVTSQNKSHYQSLFFGSVVKGLLIGAKCSLLAVKQDVTEPVRALFATDHSEYAHRIEPLLSEFDMSLDKLTVMMAADNSRGSFLSLFSEEDASKMIKELEVKTKEASDRLSDVATSVEDLVIEGRPSQAIPKAMQSTVSDLLIMGAQGQGFFQRIFIGSESFEQVMNNPYTTLVLRAEPEKA